MTLATGTPHETRDAVLHRQHTRESAARTYARTFPIVPVRADGMTVEGADGRRYLDCLSGAGTLALGHNHPVVLDALRRTLDSGAPLHVLDLATAEKDDYTGALFESLPRGFAETAKVHFCGPAGTDAVEAALKLTQTATGRRGVLAFTGAYHGMTAGALAATGNVAVKQPLPTGGEVTRLPYPYAYRCPFGVGGERGAELSAAYVERLLDDPSGGVLPPAAMILEVVQGEGGVIPAPDGWLREMRRITAERGIPLIVDEVQTGAGRTGRMWAVEHSGIVPDVMVLSKAIGGSLPMAVVLYHEDYDGWQPGAHTGTFRGNTLAMAAGAATLRHIAESGLAERAADVGARMTARLTALRDELPVIGDVRGRGLMIGVELVDPAAAPDACGAHPAAPELAARVRAGCLSRGLIVELGGRHDAVLRLLPPLTITDEQAETVLDRLTDAITEAAAALAGGRL
ncbi:MULTISPECIES: diaminobutyrate--2-oxoglutarate transaminase [Streptomyces]|uniref:Diaminobutyrate--2-oxoglutarate transaminase n=1 Tax=Streptomyces morookaense TaxID=1970 RepID=A0A7Y7B4B7_STRMO|nr:MULTISPECIES: diaminobutyrate--2-oxoglutarate transaminase [Streptomyces]MCC2273935.1 diaminobutyrate--2-oxoglutarate transaminase [Streptomyces sp. ET3-23]NVK78786.1 diaminobutyrate--2-oxoglutarate transaminase [Streptomyces morookaense]GHF34754.1 diaminobutyrate--2-oxoglutarate aminotransferase [Streptomyces morookaense]